VKRSQGVAVGRDEEPRAELPVALFVLLNADAEGTAFQQVTRLVQSEHGDLLEAGNGVKFRAGLYLPRLKSVGAKLTYKPHPIELGVYEDQAGSSLLNAAIACFQQALSR
jgi:hypothetical protein